MRVQINVQLRRVCRPPAAPFEHGAFLNREGHVVDVALYVGRRLQRHRPGANGPRCRAAHDHALGGDGARHPPLLANDDLGAGDVAFEIAVDLQHAAANDLQALTGDFEIVADDGFAGLGCARTTQRPVGPALTGLSGTAGAAEVRAIVLLPVMSKADQ